MAKELFDKSGYKGEPVIVLQATNIAFMNNSAQLIAGQLEKIGVKAQLAASDWGGVVTRRAVQKPDSEGGWDVFVTWGSGFAFSDPIGLLALAANGTKAWYGWPTDDAYEKLRTEWAVRAGDGGAQGDRRQDGDAGLGFRAGGDPRPVGLAAGLAQERQRLPRRARNHPVLEREEDLIATRWAPTSHAGCCPRCW